MSDQVVDVAGDPPPLLVQRLLGKLSPGGLELGEQLSLVMGRAPNEPGERDAHEPDAHRDLGRVLDQARHDRRAQGEQAKGHRRCPRGRPAPHDEAKQRGIEEEWFELPGSLRYDDRREHGQRHGPHGRPGHVGPDGEGSNRQRGEDEVGRGRRIGEGRDDGNRKREDGNQPPHFI
jgi:hypothetical protein